MVTTLSCDRHGDARQGRRDAASACSEPHRAFVLERIGQTAASDVARAEGWSLLHARAMSRHNAVLGSFLRRNRRCDLKKTPARPLKGRADIGSQRDDAGSHEHANLDPRPFWRSSTRPASRSKWRRCEDGGRRVIECGVRAMRPLADVISSAPCVEELAGLRLRRPNQRRKHPRYVEQQLVPLLKRRHRHHG